MVVGGDEGVHGGGGVYFVVEVFYPLIWGGWVLGLAPWEVGSVLGPG